MRSEAMDGFAAFAAQAADEAEPAPLVPDAVRAVHCWNFCQGGRLQVLPIYHAIYGIDDWELTTALMAVVDEHMPPRFR